MSHRFQSSFLAAAAAALGVFAWHTSLVSALGDKNAAAMGHSR